MFLRLSRAEMTDVKMAAIEAGVSANAWVAMQVRATLRRLARSAQTKLRAA
jgi:hypothetical protein